MKGIVETLLERLHVVDWDIRPEKQHPTFHPGRCAVLYKGDRQIGVLGEVHPLVLQNYSIGVRAYLAKLDINTLFALADGKVEYKPMPKFPATTRDLSLLCEEDLPIVEIEKTIRASAGPIWKKSNFLIYIRVRRLQPGKRAFLIL